MTNGGGPDPDRPSLATILASPELLEAFPQAAALIDITGTVVAWNRAATRLYGYAAADALGRRARQLIAGPNTEGQSSEIWAELRAGRSWSGDLAARREDGTAFTARVTLLALRDHTGDLAAVLNLADDVTEQRAQQQALASERDDLAAALAEQERLRYRLELLSSIGQRLAEAHGVEARSAVLAEAVVPGLADCCALRLVDGDGRSRLTVAHHGDAEANETLRRVLERCPIEPAQTGGVGAVIASGTPLLMGTGALPVASRPGPARPVASGAGPARQCYADRLADDPDLLAAWHALDLRSAFSVPLQAGSETIGALTLGRCRPGRWDPADRQLAIELGRQAGIMIDNARLYEAERRARSASDAAGSQLLLLAELTLALSSSLDLDQVLGRLASLLVPDLADICVVDLTEAVGERLAAVAATTPEAKAGLEEAERRLPRRTNPLSTLVATLRSGRPVLVADCDDAYLSANTPDTSVAAIYRYLGLSSILVVPLIARGRILGTITLLRTRSVSGAKIRYTEADLAPAADIAQRAALAVDNARLYTAEHHGAEQLQRGLLPEISPLPYLPAAARYLPAGSGVGGDWYDLFALTDGSAGIAIGDVMGHDMQAAASMGQLRSVFRSYAFEGADPADVLDRADRLVQTFGMAQLATAFCAQLTRLDDERWRLCYANAGHPPPVARLPDGQVMFLDEAASVLIGAPQELRRPHAYVTLPVGTTLLLYTDGLVERRSQPIDDGLAELAALVARTDGAVEDLCDQVASEMAGTDRTDDVALLAVTLY